MPTALLPVVSTVSMKFVDFVLQFQDANALLATPKVLPGLHVQVHLLDATGVQTVLLLDTRSDVGGKAVFRLPVPIAPIGQPALPVPQVQVRVLDLDGDELLKQIMKPELGKPLPAVKLSMVTQDAKIVSLIDVTAAGALNRAVTLSLQAILKKNKITSLQGLRTTSQAIFGSLAGLDKIDYDELLAHANLQLLSRNHATNRELIKAGFGDVISITETPRADFLSKMVGTSVEKNAGDIHDLAYKKVEVLKNLALERRVSSTNGFVLSKKPMLAAAAASVTGASDQPPCQCDCQSAVSPLAYLADLLDFVLREVTYNGNRLTLDALADGFCQPFSRLPADCSASEESVRQVRICIEVLRSKTQKAGQDITGVASRHVARAYDALLAALGTSQRELRLLRGSDEARVRKAQALGIAGNQLNGLLLSGSTLSEASLEELFGLQDTSRDPLSFGLKLGDLNNNLLGWSLRGVEYKGNTDTNGRIYGRLKKVNTKFTVTLCTDSARDVVVAQGEGNQQTGGKSSDIVLTAVSNSNLQGRVLVASVATDVDFELVAVPKLLIWQLSELVELWRREDHEQPSFDVEWPIIDPDVLTAAHFRHPLRTTDANGHAVVLNAAHALWTKRQLELQAKLDELDQDSARNHAPRTIPEMITKVWPQGEPDWVNMATDLQGADEGKVRTRLDELKRLYLTPETFVFLNELRKRALASVAATIPAATDPEIIAREQKERELALDILLNVVKRRDLYPVWRNQQGPAGQESAISLSPTFFCTPDTATEPVHPLRVAPGQIDQWLAVLECNSRTPIIDPDMLNPVWGFVARGGVADELYQVRATQLNRIQSVFDGLPSSQRTLNWLDDRLGTSNLTDASGQVVLHALGLGTVDPHGLETIAQTQAAFDSRRLDLRPQQHGLEGRELNTLLTLRKLIADGLADEQDWRHITHILIQAEKRRYFYPSWRKEESVRGLTLSPEFFRVPDADMLRLAPPDDRPAEQIEWCGNPSALRAWLSQLQARREQKSSVRKSLCAVVDQAEAAILPALRDDLVDVLYGGNASNREENKKAVTNTLLINAFESGCRKTSRIAQAIETLQLIVWGVLNHQLEGQKFNIPNWDQDKFSDNWHWLRSYAIWRSAMFVYLYPENFLQPRLRPQEEQTELFKAIVRVLDGTATPPGARQSEADSGTSSQAETLSEEESKIQELADAVYGFVGEAQPSSWIGIDNISRNIEALRVKSGDGVYSSGGDIRRVFDYIDGADDARREDSLYLPLHYAVTLHQSGDYEGAIKWFATIFDIDGGRLRVEIAKILSDLGSSGIGHYNAETWLNDTLNPHRLAGTRTDVNRRFILISLIRCLLDYAEAEFTTDTSESLARARELYLSVQRLLDKIGPALPGCDTGRLIIEIGERYRNRPDLADIAIGIAVDLGAEIDPDRYANLLKEIDLIRDKAPQPIQGLRNDVNGLFRKYITPTMPVAMDSRVDGVRLKQGRILRDLLKEPETFRMVQQVETARPTGTPRYYSAAVVGLGVPAGISSWRNAVGAGNKILVPGVPFEFCIPPNPILISLRLRSETGLFKLNHCMNLAGLRREVPAYAASTDTRSGMPAVGVSGALSLPLTNRLQGTQYRYKVLVERAKQLLGIAQQLESTYLSFLEKLDQENYNILRARQDLGLANANVTLMGLRVDEAAHGKDLAREQMTRANASVHHFDELINEPDYLDYLETGALILQVGAAAAQLYLAGVGMLAGFAAGGAFGAPAGPTAALAAASGGAGGLVMGAMAQGGQGLSTLSSAITMWVGYERRKQEWQFQMDIAEIDKSIADIQKTLADDRFDIVKQEEAIAKISANNADDAVNFLSNKFTNADLYQWMCGTIGNAYRFFLEQSTALAKMAQMQLAFERQEQGLDFILSDYWAVTSSSGALGSTQNGQADRRGMTGSARLLQDLYRLDQHAFTTDRRKLQMTKIISLAMHDPMTFQQFRATGVLPFTTTLELFDRDFPGHYLRLIKRIRTSVIALIPPTHGIKAKLSSTGISRVVVSAESGGLFEERVIPHEPESVALTSPGNDSGVLDLQEQSEMLLPFEGLGVANSWEFSLPRAANAFDFGTIADVLITIEYTALESSSYRQQIIQQLDRTVSAERPFSFRHQFADAWYDLHNSSMVQDASQQMVVTFTTRREDFPPNVSELTIKHLSLFVVYKSGVTERISNLGLFFKAQGQASASGGTASPGDDGIASTRRGNAGSWHAMQGKPPIGEWMLSFRGRGVRVEPEIIKLFDDDGVEDILFVITFQGSTVEWPS